MTKRPDQKCINAAQEAILREVDDHLRFNVAAYGKAWTGEGEDTQFIIGRSGELAAEAIMPTVAKQTTDEIATWLESEADKLLEDLDDCTDESRRHAIETEAAALNARAHQLREGQWHGPDDESAQV